MKYLHDKNKWGVNEHPTILERLLVLIFRVRVIYKKDGTYLRRFYLTPRWKWLPFKIFLHHIFFSDARVVHSHPWPYSSWMLTKLYHEWYKLDSSPQFVAGGTQILARRTVKRGDYTKNGIDHIHRLDVPEPCWTLVIVGRAQRMWGFFPADKGFVPWREYLNTPDAPDYPEDVVA